MNLRSTGLLGLIMIVVGGLESLGKCENIFSLEKNDQNQSFALY